MATMVLDDAFVSIDGNDISSNVRSVNLEYNAEEIEDTNMGDDTRTFLGGLKNWSAQIELSQDFAASALDSILFPLVGTVVTAIIRPDSGSVSTSNPNFTGSVLVTGYPPLGNAVGELAITTLSIRSAGTLSRATS